MPIIERRHLDELIKEFPQARRKVRRATVQIAFTRAMVALAHASKDMMDQEGHNLNMVDALSKVHEDRAHSVPRLKEPSKRVLANSMASLVERVERMSENHEAGRAELRDEVKAELGAQLGALRADMSTLLQRFGLRGAGGATANGGSAGGAGSPPIVNAVPSSSAAAAPSPPQRARSHGRAGLAERPPPARRKQRVGRASAERSPANSIANANGSSGVAALTTALPSTEAGTGTAAGGGAGSVALTTALPSREAGTATAAGGGAVVSAGSVLVTAGAGGSGSSTAGVGCVGVGVSAAALGQAVAARAAVTATASRANNAQKLGQADDSEDSDSTLHA